MQARVPLMIEHLLLERMFAIIQDALTHIQSTRRVYPLFLDPWIRWLISSGCMLIEHIMAKTKISSFENWEDANCLLMTEPCRPICLKEIS